MAARSPDSTVAMTALLQFNTWLTGTTLGWAVRGGVPWIWPLCETLHFMGMALLVGIVWRSRFAVARPGRGLPVSPSSKLLPWGLAGFALNLVTGFLFYAGAPEQHGERRRRAAESGVRAEAPLHRAAGLNVVVFYARQGSIARWNRSKRDRTHPSPRNSSAARRCFCGSASCIRAACRRSSAAHSGALFSSMQPGPFGVWATEQVASEGRGRLAPSTRPPAPVLTARPPPGVIRNDIPNHVCVQADSLASDESAAACAGTLAAALTD